MKFLVSPRQADRAYHDTYYVIANYSALVGILIPNFIVGPLLFIRAHPRRSAIDIALFWAVVALSLAASFVFLIVINGGGMPRRFMDYARIEILITLPRIFRLVSIALLIYAALRPLVSWWRARKAAHAL